MKRKLWISTGLALIGFIGGYFVGVYQLMIIDPAMADDIITAVGSKAAFYLMSATQSAILTWMAGFLGLIFIDKTHFKLHSIWQKKPLVYAVLIAFFSALLIVFTDYFVFSHYLSLGLEDYTFNLYYFLGGLLYGGVVEEVLVRLFVMSAIILFISKFILRHKEHHDLKPWVYLTAIIMSALLFGALHLPATTLMFDLSFLVIVRALLLNGIPGIFFGLLFWRYGLSYAILSHAVTHIFMQLIWLPIFYH